MIVLLTTADTEVLATASGAASLPDDFPEVRAVNPTLAADAAGLVDEVLARAPSAVLVRLLGGRRAWDGFDRLAARCAAEGIPLLAFSGEAEPDAELTAASTAPSAVVAEAFEYLVQGGVANMAQLLRFVSDTVGRTGFGFEPPAALPGEGVYGERAADPSRPTVGVVFYRTHWMSGNTGFVDALCDAIEAAGGNALPVFCYSLRPDADGRAPALELLDGRADAVVATVLAMGGSTAADAGPRSAEPEAERTHGGRLAGPRSAEPEAERRHGGRLAGPRSAEPEAERRHGGRLADGDSAWSVPALEALGVPVVQAICATSSRAAWEASDSGLSPLDAAMQVAIPEFDGRLISVPFSFKEVDEHGVARYAADPERAARVAGIALRLARLRRKANADKRVAIMLSNYPTKHSRIGNAVGLDTPASAVRLLDALTDAGYDTGDWAQRGWDRHPVSDAENGAQVRVPSSGDQLVHALIAAGGFDTEFLTEAQLAANPARVSAETYERWFARLPADLQEAMTAKWGPPPGQLYLHEGDLALAGIELGNVFLAIQPPRGFGENPVAIYHDPDLPPTHHYLAAYRWLDEQWGADAVLHLGKHGTLEWMPGKGLGLSAGCAPDAILGDLPLLYPFVVNDPGEGTQAKRRAHALIVDHLVPPMTRAETYDELAQLEQLLDEYYQVSTLDPAKVTAIRGEIWQLLRSAELTRDLDLPDWEGADGEDGWGQSEFDDMVVHVDGYLCEIKDLQIRGGLHILGDAPDGENRIGLILAILRLGQAGLPGLRAAVGEAFGLSEADLLADPGARIDVPSALIGRFEGPAHTASDAIDRLEDAARALVEAMDAKGWDAEAAASVVADVLDLPVAPAELRQPPGASPAAAADATDVQRCAAAADVVNVLGFAATDVVPRLAQTDRELTMLLRGLSGGYVPSGPSGSPTRGRADVLPTGKNFYSVDPKALPSELSWQVGQRLAEDLVARYLDEEGRHPTSIGIVVWGTSAMRTHGDDIAEIFALLGVRPVWNRETRRVTGLELMSLAELGRPRVDVTVRISGFFRDAFPHLVALIDDAVAMVADLDEGEQDNPLAAHVRADVAAGTAPRQATARVFGSKPGAYGAGLLPLIDARNWQTDADLAEVYAVWGGYAYGRGLDGTEARGAMERTFARMQVAVKNTDTREHDLFDSDDYFQYHGGMVAAVRALTGASPKAYVGDSADPARVRTKDLREETARVFRARVANPKWISAMQRHGYKGAFELSATVDYLFGYDATAGVVEDWMYQTLSEKYVFDDAVRAFMEQSNPWALRAIAERLLEAAERGLWAEPDADTLDRLRAVYLESEGDLEERTS